MWGKIPYGYLFQTDQGKKVYFFRFKIRWNRELVCIKITSIPRKVQAIILGPLRTLVTDDHCMLHWFCALVAWPCYYYRKRLTPGNWLVFKITTLTRFDRYGMVKLHTNQFSGVNLLLHIFMLKLLFSDFFSVLCNSIITYNLYTSNLLLISNRKLYRLCL